jgi:hypothetical protein
MSYRITKYNINDFILDYDNVAESINKTCRRDHLYYRVSGVCQTNDEVVIAFEEDYDSTEWSYVIKPFPGSTTQDIEGEIHSRWQGKFSTRALVQLPDQALGVFERTPAQRRHLD